MARSFNNSTSTYIEHYLGAQYDPPITIACWIRPFQTNVNDTYVSLNAGAVTETLGTSVQLRVNSLGQVGVRSATEVGFNDQANTNLFTANAWNHLAGRWESSTSRIAYLNGIASATGTASRATTGLEYLILGRGSGQTYDPALAVNGSLAEVAVWNAALNTNEIVSLSEGYRASLIRPNNLVAYLPLVRDVIDVISSETPTVNATTVAVHPQRIA
jgi:hypothetical protein